MDNLIRSKMSLIIVMIIMIMQSQKFRNILFKRIEMYGIDGKEDRVSFFASVAR